MKRSALLAAGLPALLAPAPLPADPCLDNPDMVRTLACVRASARAANDALDDAYRRLRERFAGRPQVLERLRDARQSSSKGVNALLYSATPQGPMQELLGDYKVKR